MPFAFPHPVPLPWLLAEIFALAVSVYLFALLLQRVRHPAVIMLEGFGFVFLYASVFENFAVANGWYMYGRSLFMIWNVPLSVPLIEACVFFSGLWLLEKMNVPDFWKPWILGWFGMLQDFSLDPVAVRQVFTSEGVTSGRWTWLLPPGSVHIFTIPVYNFPGWMLIMLYGSAFVLLGRWWFRRSGCKPWIGFAYPLAAAILALLSMLSPVSQILLWLWPFYTKGSNAEWVLLGFHLAFPVIVLICFWHGRMRDPLRVQQDAPVLVIPLLFHLFDIASAVAGGFWDVVWLLALASFVQIAFIGFIFWVSRRMPQTIPATAVEP